MTLVSDLAFLSAFLIIGFVLRQLIRPFRTYFIPASVIGGVIALILGPQVLGFVEIPKSFSAMSSALILIITTAPILGAVIDRKRIRSYADYLLLAIVTYGVQLALGVGLGALLSVVWPALPDGWGIMAVFSFWGGHGTASAAGAAFKSLGVEGNLSIGMILSTVGLVSAIVFGMVILNWGVRKGYAEKIDDSAKLTMNEGGVIPRGKRDIIGEERVDSSGINNLAFQFGILLCCLFLGGQIMKVVKHFVPAASYFPGQINGIIGALIIWPLMQKFKIDEYLDRRAITNIAGLCLEVVILSSIATLDLKILGAFIIPIIIMSVVCLLVTAWICVWLPRKITKDSWFEKGVTQFGQATGSVPTGLALLRCLDPHTETSVIDSVGVQNSLMSPFYTIMAAVGPMMVVANFGLVVGMGILMMAGAIILCRIFLWNK